MRGEDKLFRGLAFRDLRNRLRTSSSNGVGIRRTEKALEDRSIGHEYHLHDMKHIMITWYLKVQVIDLMKHSLCLV